jgi:hypothetical protein
MTHDVRHLVVTTIVHTLHGVQDTTLYGLETVAYMRHGTLQDYIRGIVQKPILVHTAEMVNSATTLLFVVCHFTGFSVQIYEKDMASHRYCDAFFIYLS